MEEIEVPIEKVQEDIHHHALHGAEAQSWITWGALLSAILAVFAAVAALLAGHHANEAMMEQVRSSDQWAFYQSKGLKAALLESRQEILAELRTGKEPGTEKITEKLAEYKKEQAEIQEHAKELEKDSEVNLRLHEILAKAVTLFQIAIAMTAISVLSKRKPLLYAAVAFGALGLVFLVQGTLLH